MGAEYFATLASISAEIIALAITFYAGYLVYLREQRDKYREELVKDFKELDRTIFQWSVLEEYPISWCPPMSKYLQILEKESWKESPLESLKDVLEKLDQTFMETHKEEMKLRSQTKGYLPAAPALYNRVKFALHDLIQQIYREFPPPPGDYKVSEPPGEIPYAVKSFVRCDFPHNRESFIAWTKRYDAFFEGLYTVYYRIKPIINKLKKVRRESAEQTKKYIMNLEKIGGLSWAISSLRESEEYSITEINYYEQFFQFLGKMRHKIDEIKDKIATYDNYFYKGKYKTIFSFAVMVLTGVFIPFTVLFFKPEWLELEILKIFSGMGFGLSTLSAIFLIYRDISKF